MAGFLLAQHDVADKLAGMERDGPKLTRRSLVRTAAVVATLGPIGIARSAGDEPWPEIIENTRKFRAAADRLGLILDWHSQGKPQIALREPASEAQLAEMEARLKRPLPASLQRLFGVLSSDIAIIWSFPGKPIDDGGILRVHYTLLPPAPFADPGPPPSPNPNAGKLQLSLSRLPDLLGIAQRWAEGMLDYGAAIDAPAGHFARQVDLWRRCLPIGQTMGGEMLAIDTTDPKEQLMLLAVDGSDQAGRLLGMDIVEFVLHQSRLGFPGFERYALEAFEDQAKSKAALEAFSRRPDELDQPKSPAVLATVIDSTSANARIWRDWFGM